MKFRTWLRQTRRIRRKIHKAGVKCFTFLNAVSLLFWISYVDAICSWQPYLIMSINFCWLVLMAYANQGSVNTENENH